jgi:Ca-activated chloride channel family protein
MRCAAHAASALRLRGIALLGFLLLGVLTITLASGCSERKKTGSAGRTWSGSTAMSARSSASSTGRAGELAEVVVPVPAAPVPPPPAANVVAPPAASAPPGEVPHNTEAYARVVDSPFRAVAKAPLSTFAIDVDTASYSNARRFLLGQIGLPPKDAVRVEEFINYFSYDYPRPRGEHPVALSAEVAACPWNPKHKLVRVGLQGRTLTSEGIPPRNFVFLVDTSGSMRPENRLPLLKTAMKMLVDQLTARDRVAIVTYAGYAGLALPSTPGDHKGEIVRAIDALYAHGSTNGGEGIKLAYRIAYENFIQGGANRVILGTDGDFNVGVTDDGSLTRLIEQQRQGGIFLTVLGFGMGNLKDSTLERLAQFGNGHYAYIDSEREARKVFVEQGGALVPIAKDVRVQVEFNPRRVQAYRLVGYEHRLMRDEDFHDDTKVAGAMGSGHSVTAFYEVVPPGVQVELPGVGPLKYQEAAKPTPQAEGDELMVVSVRYKTPEAEKSRLLGVPVRDAERPFEQATADFRWAASVAAFGMLLRDSPYRGGATFGRAGQWARQARGPDREGYRAECLRMMEIAERLAARDNRP